MDDAVESLINPNATGNIDIEPGEFERWRRSEPRAEKGTEYANNPIKYWVTLRDRYPALSKLTLDVLSIPASSCECERMFSELGDLREPRRRSMGPHSLAAIQSVRRWQKAGLGSNSQLKEVAISTAEMDLLYSMCSEDSGSE
jgi:hypothetical protein